MFETKTRRRIRELEADNELLRTELEQQREQLATTNEYLKKATEALNLKSAELNRSAFAAEIRLLPCESPACKFCQNAVWTTEADGRHIAGCKKGIQCVDFQEAENKKETPAPVSVNVVPIGFPASPYYPGFNPPSSPFGLPY